MRVVWPEQAVEDYHKNIAYLSETWSEASALAFINEVSAVIEIIQDYPGIFPLSDYRGIHKAVIGKQISLFYQVENEVIYLIRLWNNYQDPDAMEFY